MTSLLADVRLQPAGMWLEQACTALAEPDPRAVAAAYVVLLQAQPHFLPAELEHFRQVAKCVRDALIVECVAHAGGHSNLQAFDAACQYAIGWDPKLDKKLYAQLHHSYQQLFATVEQKFPSNSEQQGRRRKRRNRVGQPHQVPEEPEREAEVSASSSDEPEEMPSEPEREAESGEALAMGPFQALAAPAAEELSAASVAAEPVTGGGAPAAVLGTASLDEALGAGPAPSGPGAPSWSAALPHLPADLRCEESWRRKVESLLVHLAERDVPAEVCRCCVAGLEKRLKDVQDDLWSQGAPGQELCSRLLTELSYLMQKFPGEPDLHATCVELLTWMCAVRGDVLGLQAPGISQERPREGAIAHLDRDAQRCVKAAVDIAEQADVSELILAREARTRLLVQTQPLSELLGPTTALNDKHYLVLDEVKQRLSWYIDAIKKPQHKEYARAFLQEVRLVHQQECSSTELWVHRPELSGNYKSYRYFEDKEADHEDSFKMQERFTVAGLLFGVSAHILDPLPQREDTREIKTSLSALWDLHEIQPFGWSTQVEVVNAIRKLGGNHRRERCRSPPKLLEYWMGCEAAYMGLLGTLLQGSLRGDAASPRALDAEAEEWVIQEACDIVGHATDCATTPATGSDNTWVLSPTLWCLSQVFEGAPPADAWRGAVARAARRALQYCLDLDSKSRTAQESEEEATKLRRMFRGGLGQ
jgi:hypothetical protein